MIKKRNLITKNKKSLGGWFAGLGSKLDGLNANLTDSFFDSKFGQGLSGFGIKAGNIGGMANTATTAIGGLLAGQNKTGVGTALQGIGSLASNIPGVGGLIGAGVNLIGGLTNAAFGSNINKEFVNQTEQAARQQSNYLSKASDNEALLSDWNALSFLQDVNKSDVGSEGWFSDKATDETNRLNDLVDDANMRALASINNTAENIDKQKNLLMQSNYTAYGGPLSMKYTGVMSPFGNQFYEGGPKNSIPTQEEYIAEQIAAKRAAALDKSRNRTEPVLPIINGIPNKNSCIYTATDNYGKKYRVPGNWTFYENPEKYGFTSIDINDAQAGDIIQVLDKGAPYHAMILDGYDEQGRPLYNYSRGSNGDSSDIVKSSTNFPNTEKLAYTFTGTPADSTQWINEYKEMYNKKAKGGPLKDSEYYSIMERVAKDNYKKWGFKNVDEALAHALNDNTYNYRGYYSKYPKSKANADTHWTDEFKTVYHPTFSNESVYSGKVSQYNPEGLIGGSWDGETFIPANWQNKKAEGGSLFTNGVTFINNGDTHENNPLEGVRIGVDENNIPNLVEEGEVIYDDYVFSNRLRVPKEVRQKYKLRGETFADAAKQLQKESEERPNDPISKDSLNASMQMLTNEQEKVRMEKENNKYAKGGRLCNKFLLGGEPIIDNPYSVYSSIPKDNFDFSKWFTIDKNNLGKVTGYSDAYRNYKFTADKAREWAALFGNDESLKSYLSKGNKLEDLTDEDVQKGSLDNKHGWLHKARAMMANLDNANTIDVDGIIKGLNSTSFEPLSIKSVPIKIEDEIVDEKPLPSYKGIEPMKKHWLRYAPIVGSGLAVANDLFGGNEPDYSNADMFARAITNSNRQIGYRPIGNYLQYNPFDRDYYINKLDANTAAGRRAVVNNSGGNRAAALAGILATDYNYGNQLGDLVRKAEEYNLEQRQKVEDFNRNTNMFNSEMGTKVDMFNAGQAMQRAGMYGNLAEYRDKILAANRAEKSANLTNFIQGLSDLGREITDRDMLRWLADLGVLKYDGKGKYTGDNKSNKTAKGDRINRKKRGGFTI